MIDPLIPANHIGELEARAAYKAVRKYPLSGFLGGEQRGGRFVCELEDRWTTKFKVKHAIACNSATSGLLAACAAVEITPGTHVSVPCFTMSATAAAPCILGAELWFGDCDRDDFCLSDWEYQPHALIVTNLFGHPAELAMIKKICLTRGTYLIEDNAQAILAMEGDHYAGTIGDIGVFSLNVHKAIHAGEGGVCVTNDDDLAHRLRGFVNHGELAGGVAGLNLRLTEYAAAIAIEQLNKLDAITAVNVAQAEKLTIMARGFPWLIPPKVRENCTHVYYCWACKVADNIDRAKVVTMLNDAGFPMRPGYVNPIHYLPAFSRYGRPTPVAEELHARSLMIFENTLYLLTDKQIDQLGNTLLKIEKAIL